MVIARSDDMSIRALRDDDADFAQLATWLCDPRVLEWFAGRDQPHDIARIRGEYAPRVLAAQGVQPCLVEERGVPIGYIQYFCVAPYVTEYGLDPTIDAGAIWAIDLFIGEPDRWGSGIGTRVVSLMVEYLFVEVGASQVLIDPRVVNVRAIRSYEKVGFRKVRVLEGHEQHEGQSWDNWLMAVDALDHPVGLTAHLARIDSINPGLMPGAPGEGAIADFVVDWATSRGLDVERTEVAPGRHNVVVARRGYGGGRSLLFNAHLDTVGVTDGSTARVRLADGRLEGRGVLDTKGGLAAALIAAVSIGHHELAGDVIVAGVADEEFASIGTEALVGSWSGDAAIVLEPTDLAIVNEHRGFAVVEAQFRGSATHTSTPHRGVNAVHAAATATAALIELDRRWTALDPHPARRPSVLVSGVRSCGETFTVPALCTMTVEVRTVEVCTAEGGADDQVDQVMSELRHSVAGDDGSVTIDVIVQRPPMRLAGDHELVAAVHDAISTCSGRAPTVTAAPYWTDAALHASAGAPAVVLGPIGEGLHEDLEWVATDSLAVLTRALAATARNWCG